MHFPIHPPFGSNLKVRTAALIVFGAFTILFAAYVDLFLVLDDHAFRVVPQDFWTIYRFTFVAFVVLVAAVLMTALFLARAVMESDQTPLPEKNTMLPIAIVVAIASLVSWILFFTVHGFAISVVAVLSTFAILLSVTGIVLRKKAESIPYRYATIPTIIAVLAMLSLVVLIAMSYVTLHSVAPNLFSAHTLELSIVLALMIAATILAGIFGVRSLLTF
ncbi:MAG: hypothetical protein M3Z24_07890 [Chloroflexota bacterium]|nr:hypothetical protein [Chloroflexota bacterium]